MKCLEYEHSNWVALWFCLTKARDLAMEMLDIEHYHRYVQKIAVPYATGNEKPFDPVRELPCPLATNGVSDSSMLPEHRANPTKPPRRRYIQSRSSKLQSHNRTCSRLQERARATQSEESREIRRHRHTQRYGASSNSGAIMRCADTIQFPMAAGKTYDI